MQPRGKTDVAEALRCADEASRFDALGRPRPEPFLTWEDRGEGVHLGRHDGLLYFAIVYVPGYFSGLLRPSAAKDCSIVIEFSNARTLRFIKVFAETLASLELP